MDEGHFWDAVIALQEAGSLARERQESTLCLSYNNSVIVAMSG